MLIYHLLVSVILPKALPSNPSGKGKRYRETRIGRLATLYTAVHLLNPMVFTISTRGSSESILSSFVLLTLYCALKERWDAAAVFLGISTHWKMYPVIFGVGCLRVVGRGDGGREELDRDKDKERHWKYMRELVNRRTLRFGALSAGTFYLLGVLCYLV